MPHARTFSYRSLVAVGLLLLFGAVLAGPAHAQPAPPPASADNGFGNLTARWWTWVYDHPAVTSGRTNTFPILDTTGEFAAAGQENGIGPANKYFFLAGTFGGVGDCAPSPFPRERRSSSRSSTSRDNAVEPPTNYKVPELKQRAKAVIDTADRAHRHLRRPAGRHLPRRVPVFDYTVPAENSIYDFFGAVGPQFEGRIKPAVSDGYSAYIPPPLPGSTTYLHRRQRERVRPRRHLQSDRDLIRVVRRQRATDGALTSHMSCGL